MNYIYVRCGESGLRELLDRVISPDEELLEELGSAFKGYDRETLQRDAGELLEMNLSHVADIVFEAATAALPERELLCPYQPEDRANHERWQASYDRRKLRLNPVPPDRVR
jgi:hypothetical protein